FHISTGPLGAALMPVVHGTCVAPETSSPRGGDRFRLDTGHHRLYRSSGFMLLLVRLWDVSRKAKKLAPLYSRGVTSQLCSSLWPVSCLAILRYATAVAFLQGEIPYKIAPFFGI